MRYMPLQRSSIEFAGRIATNIPPLAGVFCEFLVEQIILTGLFEFVQARLPRGFDVVDGGAGF